MCAKVNTENFLQTLKGGNGNLHNIFTCTVMSHFGFYDLFLLWRLPIRELTQSIAEKCANL
jgi:hypothetical protein